MSVHKVGAGLSTQHEKRKCFFMMVFLFREKFMSYISTHIAQITLGTQNRAKITNNKMKAKKKIKYVDQLVLH